MDIHSLLNILKEPTTFIRASKILVYLYPDAVTIIYHKNKEQHELFIYDYNEKESLGLVFGDEEVISVDVTREGDSFYVLILWGKNRIEARWTCNGDRGH